MASTPFVLLAAGIAALPTAQVTEGAQGQQRPASNRDVLQQVRVLARTNPKRLGLGDADALRDPRVLPVSGGYVVKARRAHQGYPVLGESMAVRVDADGSIRHINTDFEPLQLRHNVAISRDAARRIAARFVYGRRETPSQQPPQLPARLAISGRHAAWVYQVAVPGFLPWQARMVLVHASSGAVVQVQSPVRHAVTDAKAYMQTPAGTDSLSDPSDVTLPRLEEPEGDAPWELSGEYVRANSCLTGEDTLRVRTCEDVSIPFVGSACQFGQVRDLVVPFCGAGHRAKVNGDTETSFAFSPNDDLSFDYPNADHRKDKFAEVHAYYHLDRVVDWVAALGQSPGPQLSIMANVLLPAPELVSCASEKWANASLGTVDARDLVNECRSGGTQDFQPFSNAFYLHDSNDMFDLPSLLDIPGGIYMGQGNAADFAYDGNIIYHEFGHALAAQVGAFSGSTVLEDEYGLDDSPGALNEAFADYFAAALSGGPTIGGFVGERLGLDGGALRTLEHDLECPEYWVGQVHTDSQGFAGALWAARDKYPQTETVDGLTIHVFDRAVLDALTMLTDEATHADAYAAVIESVKAIDALDDSTAEKANQVLQARNIHDCTRIRALGPNASIDEMNLAAAASGGGGGSLNQFMGASGYTPYAPPPVQLQMDVAALGSGDAKRCAKLEASIAAPPLTAESAPDFLGGESEAPDWQAALLQKAEAPVAFEYSEGESGIEVSTASGADELAVTINDAGAVSAELELASDVTTAYLALVNKTPRAMRLKDITVTAQACADANSDATQPPSDNSQTGPGGSAPEEEAAPASGCAGGSTSLPALLLPLGLWWQRRQQPRA